MIALLRKRFALALGLVVCSLGLFLLSAPMVAATDVIGPGCEGVSGSTLCEDNKPQPPGSNDLYGPDGILTKVADIIALVVGVAAVIVIVVAGVRYVVSSGDSNNVNSAKNAILFAVVGLLVAILAKAIVIFVLSRI